jgi:hypothetical protein
MDESDKMYVAVGTVSVLYGVVLCLFWVWVLSWARDSPVSVTSALEGLTSFVFASVPIMLIVTGVGLYRLQARTRWIVRAGAAVTTIFLVIKAALALYWASEAKGCFGDVAKFVLTVVVAIPSGIVAFILAATAASMSSDTE